MSSNPAWQLRRNAEAFPDKVGLIYPLGRKLNGQIRYEQKTYRQLEQESDAFAYALQKAGFAHRDKTIFMVKPGPELFTMAFALFKIGAIPVVVDPGMGIKRMLHCYQSVGAETFLGIPLASAIRTLAPSFFKSIRSSATVRHGRISGSQDTPSTPFPISEQSPDDLGLINFTTGSTGPAKGVECTYKMIHASLGLIQAHHQVNRDDVQLLTAPLFGLLGMMMGNTCVLPIMDPTQPARIHPPFIEDAINRFSVSFMFGSPALLNALGRYGASTGSTLPTLRVVSSGGAPMTFGTMKLFRNMLQPHAAFDTTWGATEALPLASINVDSLLSDAKPGMAAGWGTCIGKPIGDVKVLAIRSTQGNIAHLTDDLHASPGDIGELIVQGDNVSQHYHDNPACDAEHKIADANGLSWHRTGDLGWIDEAGRIWFCGRKAHQVDLLNPPETLYSVQAEGVANNHPAVYRSALVCAQHEGENIPVMCIELASPASELEQDTIKRELEIMLHQCQKTERIQHILFHPSFPVDIRHNAKINREQLGQWATHQLHPATFQFNAWMIIPILGWLYLAAGLLWPIDNIVLVSIWWIDLFLSLVAHGAQIFKAHPLAKKAGFSLKQTIFYTMAFGATWWRPLTPAPKPSA